jgi:hypothetical protein
MSDELSIINIYEYKDCWLKREDILLQALWNELDSSKKFVQLENDFTLQVTYQSMKEYEFFLSLWKQLIHRFFYMVSNTFLLQKIRIVSQVFLTRTVLKKRGFFWIFY